MTFFSICWGCIVSNETHGWNKYGGFFKWIPKSPWVSILTWSSFWWFDFRKLSQYEKTLLMRDDTGGPRLDRLNSCENVVVVVQGHNHTHKMTRLLCHASMLMTRVRANKIYSAKLSRTISNRFSRTACQLWAPKVAWLVLSNPKNSRDLPVLIHLWDRRHHFQGANVVIRNSHGRLENGLTWRATATRRWGCGNKPSCNEVILGLSESKLHDPKRPLCTLWSPLESPPLGDHNTMGQK
jgi:hypothetical protein